MSLLIACPGDDAPVVTDDSSSTGVPTTDPSSSSGPLDPTTSGAPDGTGDGTTTDASSTGESSTGASSTGSGIECGNDMIEGDEVCDGVDLGGEDCIGQGFDGGRLACAVDCSAYDARACFMAVCGNGMQEGMEPCDGADLGGADCISEGFDSGQLDCLPDCTGLETSGCGTCGNVIVDGAEVCDDIVLLGQTCASQGFDNGQLGCSADCLTYDTAGCGICGNGIIDGDEECEGMDLAGQTCLSLGLDDGVLACSPSCGLVVSGCSDLRLFFSEDNNGNGLYELSIVDGSIVPLGASGVTSGTCGLAYDANTGTLLGSAPFQLLEIQLDGSGFASLGNMTAEGLAYDPATNTLYAALNGGFRTVDPATGATLVNLPAPGFDMEGLAFDPDAGIVYGVGDSTLLAAYDVAAGAWATIGNTGLNWDSGGLAFDAATDTLYAVASAQGTGLYTIDPVTAVPSLVGNNGLGITLRGGLAIQP